MKVNTFDINIIGTDILTDTCGYENTISYEIEDENLV